MNAILDRLALIMISIISLSLCDDLGDPVVAMLISLTAVALVRILGKGKLSYGVIAASCAVSLFLPPMFLTAPVLLFEALCLGQPLLMAPMVLVIFGSNGLSIRQVIITAAGVICAAVIYSRLSNLEKTVDKLTLLRDEITEKNIALSAQNKELIRAKYNEVHLATLKERNRIAREIHDNVGHMLTRSVLQSGALMVLNKDDDLKQPIMELKQTLDSAMTSIRTSVHDLHDDSIDLKSVIEDCVRAAEDRFKVRLDYQLGDEIPGEVKICIVGVIREGISNAIKHSKGNRITIALREHPGLYQLAFEDNGSCSEIKRTGIGITNMRDRADQVGAAITFTPSPEGFKVFMSIPKKIRQENEDENSSN